MGGGDKQLTKTHETSSGSSTSNPWEKAIPGLEGILGQLNGMIPNAALSSRESGLLDQLYQNAGTGNPYAPKIGAAADAMLTGGTDYSGRVTGAFDALNKDLRGNLAQYQGFLTPTARGDFLDPNTNPFFGQTTQNLTNSAVDRVNAMYSAAGRDPVGAGSFAQNAGKGIAEATAPIYAQIYGNERDRQLGAQRGLYDAGYGTGAALNTAANNATGLLSNLQQMRFGNMTAGTELASRALNARDAPLVQQLAIEGQRRDIPTRNLGMLSSMLIPMAQLGGTNNFESVKDSTSESQIKKDPTNAIIGAAISAAGMAMGIPPVGAMGGMSGLLGGSGFGGGLLGGGGGLFGGALPYNNAYGSNPFTPYGTINPAYG